MKKQAVATGFFLLSFLLPLRAMAATFSQLYVFGDSLSDTGNAFKATKGLVPPRSLYANGRFSNGSIWVDYLAQDLGLKSSPNTNFAFGGATSGSSNTIPFFGLPGLQQEIDGFTQANPKADPNGLYIVWAGANDFLGGGVTDPTLPVTNVLNAVTSLAGVGAQNILVVDLPNLGKIPSANKDNQLSSQLSYLSGVYNSGLSQTLDALKPQLGTDVNLTFLDVSSLFNQVIANPAEFNFTDVTNACLAVVSCASGDQNTQNQSLFWDSLHPTTAGHKLVADFAFSSLNTNPPAGVPEPSSALGVLGFGVLGVSLRLKRKQKKASSIKSR